MAPSNLQFPVLLWCTCIVHVTSLAVGQTRRPGESRVLVPDEDDIGPRCYSLQHDSYCEEVFDYPSKDIRRFLVRNGSFSVFFNRARPILSTPTVKVRYGPDADDNYPEENTEEQRVCDVSERLARPRAAKNRNGVMRYIVNDGYEYQQYIKVETCRRQNEACSGIAGALASGYTSRCAQKYTSSLLVAFDENFHEPFMDDFEFPTACVCLIRHRFYR